MATTATAALADRYTHLGANGKPNTGDNWVAVHDAQTGLTWTRRVVEGGPRPFAEAMRACAELELLGGTDWRAPTVDEQLSIAPLDREHFDGENGWCWTSTRPASLPGGAVVVHTGDGRNRPHPGTNTHEVRAVRPGA